jgi:hypothetical protein
VGNRSQKPDERKILDVTRSMMLFPAHIWGGGVDAPHERQYDVTPDRYRVLLTFDRSQMYSYRKSIRRSQGELVAEN